ncbi:MAG: SRPBCC domain-containing protein [Pseudoramibacter sp.]
MLNEINWPQGYLPGTTDNFASNEIIVKGISAKDVFDNLIDTSIWTTYYDNASDIEFLNTPGTKLAADTRFKFKTFGFPIDAEIIEFEAPHDGQPGRLAWHGWADGDAEHRLDVVHAWLLEDLPEDRVRILTQESQKGKPAKDLFNSKPDIMNQGHQDWIKGLAATVLAAKQA